MKNYSILKLKILQLSIILTVLVHFFTSIASAGKEGGGGGNVCFVSQGSQLLLDLDRPGRLSQYGDYHQPGHRIVLDQLNNDIGFAAINPLIYEPLRQAVLARVAGISKDLVEFKTSIFNSLFKNGFRFFAIPSEFRYPIGADFSLSDLCARHNSKAIFVFSEGLLFLSVPNWNLLSLGVQADLLIHEGTRNIQKNIGIKFTDLEVQTLTWALLTQSSKTIKELNFLNVRLSEYLGLKQSHQKFCEFKEDFQFIRQLFSIQNSDLNHFIQSIGQVCENILTFESLSGSLIAQAVSLSQKFDLKHGKLPELAAKFAEFVSKVRLEQMAASSNRASDLSKPSIEASGVDRQNAVLTDQRELENCKSNKNSEGCQIVIKHLQDLLDKGMAW